ncbi:hypothetical protein [Wenyingzhuangia sp. IMCC45574]
MSIAQTSPLKVNPQTNSAPKTNNNQTENQLVGKWYYASRDSDKKSKTQNLVEGKFLQLEANHHFNSDAFTHLKDGNWSFNLKTQILSLKTQKHSSNWLVKKVNEFGMILIHAESNEKWTFFAADE